MAEVQKRSIEQVEAELGQAHDALGRLDAEDRDLRERIGSLFQDKDGELEKAALAGKSLGKGAELRKLQDRLQELPALVHVLKRRQLMLRIEAAELRYEEAERARVAAISELDEALQRKLEAEDRHAQASGVASAAHWARDDARRGLLELQQALDRHERARPGSTEAPEPDPEADIRDQFAASLARAEQEAGAHA